MKVTGLLKPLETARHKAILSGDINGGGDPVQYQVFTSNCSHFAKRGRDGAPGGVITGTKKMICP